MASLAHVLTWCGLTGDAAVATTPAGSLLALLGAAPNLLPRSVGIIDEAAFNTALSSWTVASASPSLMLSSAAREFGRICRVHSGVELSRSAAAAAASSAALALVAASAPAAPRVSYQAQPRSLAARRDGNRSGVHHSHGHLPCKVPVPVRRRTQTCGQPNCQRGTGRRLESPAILEQGPLRGHGSLGASSDEDDEVPRPDRQYVLSGRTDPQGRTPRAAHPRELGGPLGSIPSRLRISQRH